MKENGLKVILMDEDLSAIQMAFNMKENGRDINQVVWIVLYSNQLNNRI